MASLKERIDAARRAEQNSAGGSLAQRIAEARQKEEALAAIAEERANEDWSPTSGQSGFDNFIAGVGQGASNIGRNLGNMVGLVSDEDLAEAKQLDEALLDTTAGSVGSFAGEMAALAPLGAAGAIPKAAGAASKAVPALGRAGQALTNTLARVPGAGQTAAMAGRAASSAPGQVAARFAPAAGQGAAAGAITGDPGDRLQSAAEGAALGSALSGTVGALGSRLGRGVINLSDDAKKYRGLVEGTLGRNTTIPIAQGAGDDGASTFGKVAYKNVLPLFPMARKSLHTQADKALADWQEAVIRRSYNKQIGQEVVDEFKRTGNIKDAIKLGNSKAKWNPLNRQVLEDTVLNLPAGQTLTPKTLDKVARRHAGPNARPAHEDLTEYGQRVLGESVEESTVSARNVFHNATDAATTVLPFLGGPLAGTATVAATSGLASGPVSRALSGQTGVQRTIQNFGEEASARTQFMLDALRNTTVANLEALF